MLKLIFTLCFFGFLPYLNFWYLHPFSKRCLYFWAVICLIWSNFSASFKKKLNYDGIKWRHHEITNLFCLIIHDVFILLLICLFFIKNIYLFVSMLPRIRNLIKTFLLFWVNMPVNMNVYAHQCYQVFCLVLLAEEWSPIWDQKVPNFPEKCHKLGFENHLFGDRFTNRVILLNFEQQLKNSLYNSKPEASFSKIQRNTGLKMN